MLMTEVQPRAIGCRRQPALPFAATVLVTGAGGLLGTALCARLARDEYRVISHTRSGSGGFLLEDAARIEPAIGSCHPDWIIHAAGNTNLDACEADPAAAGRLHVAASTELARAAALHGSRFLYVSTDSVYDGDLSGPHGEADPVRPVNHYARTKWGGEEACLRALPTTVVARVNFFGVHPMRPQGLVAWLLENLRSGRDVNGFTDVHFNPLLNHDLADLLTEMVARDLAGGIYNLGAADACSKHEFARRVARRLGTPVERVRPTLLADSGLPTPRPRNTVMDIRKITAALGRRLPTIDDGLDRLFATLTA